MDSADLGVRAVGAKAGPEGVAEDRVVEEEANSFCRLGLNGVPSTLGGTPFF